VRFLDISPYFYTRNNIDGFSVNQNTAEISWQHFDAGEGLKVKVVYVSSTPKWVILIGYVAGSEFINRQQLEAQHTALNNIVTKSTLPGVVGAILLSLASLLMIRRTARNTVMIWINVMSLSLSADVLAVLYHWEWGLPRPPF
jgi:hypothetical protein